ncbi:hypothetical protein FHO69_22750 [Vibrio vulnificus]|nr:hypothetical protein [Vibrio vulnificus]
MNIIEVTHLIWTHKAELKFGSLSIWDENTFKKEWVDEQVPGLWCNKEGLYWFSANLEPTLLLGLERPNSLPTTGCDFGYQANKNASLLKGNLCSDNGLPIIYNGHRSQVMSRLRSHFMISDGTGALGITEYDLSQYSWSAFVFHIDMIDSISELDDIQKSYIRSLMRDETGRAAIESAWRTLYGWPVMCKK